MTHSKQDAKISFAVSSSSSLRAFDGGKESARIALEIAVHEALLAAGAKKNVGPPPAGHLERDAMRFLEKFSGEGKGRARAASS